MSVDGGDKGQAGPKVNQVAGEAKALIRSALKGSLATLQRSTGHPYASLVLTATEADGAPVFLISKLAVHTQNIEADPRVSLLVDGTGNAEDPMTGARVTLIGRVTPTVSPTAKRRFLARHPSAEEYAGFADFSFYTLHPEGAHFIGGFGRIVDLTTADITTSLGGADELIGAEPDIVSHMNDDHADAIALYATVLAGAESGDWRMTGVDPEGCDLVCGSRAVRIAFGDRVSSANEARQELVRLVKAAREKSD